MPGIRTTATFYEEATQRYVSLPNNERMTVMYCQITDDIFVESL